ncbi:hypothetical protein [Burkholderia ubonensis]|uniref:hypothetical protein n=1 Tax=Burkholderia ubonensis TaxID=101571 RepID=UPI0012FCC69F|nr:hypothetical protein [Burkholderia ubonensis]
MDASNADRSSKAWKGGYFGESGGRRRGDGRRRAHGRAGPASARDERIGAEAAGMVGAVRAPLRERRRRADVRDEGGQRAVRTAGTARTALESWILINR